MCPLDDISDVCIQETSIKSFCGRFAPKWISQSDHADYAENLAAGEDMRGGGMIRAKFVANFGGGWCVASSRCAGTELRSECDVPAQPRVVLGCPFDSPWTSGKNCGVSPAPPPPPPGVLLPDNTTITIDEVEAASAETNDDLVPMVIVVVVLLTACLMAVLIPLLLRQDNKANPPDYGGHEPSSEGVRSMANPTYEAPRTQDELLHDGGYIDVTEEAESGFGFKEEAESGFGFKSEVAAGSGADSTNKLEAKAARLLRKKLGREPSAAEIKKKAARLRQKQIEKEAGNI